MFWAKIFIARNFCSIQSRPWFESQRPPSPVTPSAISSRQKMWRRGRPLGGNGILAQAAFSSTILHSRIRETAMPAESGCHSFLYCEIATSKPSVAMSILPLSLRVAARSPRNVSEDHVANLPLCGILSDSGLWWTIGPSKESPLDWPV